MAAGYVIVNLDVKDPAAYEAYKAKAPGVIKQYGGEYIVRGGETTVDEGTWKPVRMVVLKFPSAAQAKAFLASPEYAPLKKIRQSVAKGEVVVVEGV